jgi:hypothetical protein
MHRSTQGRDYIALALAIGICTALNMITFAVLFDAVYNHRPGQILQGAGGLGENTTQILTGWGGGIIGILGAVFGYKAGQAGVEIPEGMEPPDVSDLSGSPYVDEEPPEAPVPPTPA